MVSVVSLDWSLWHKWGERLGSLSNVLRSHYPSNPRRLHLTDLPAGPHTEGVRPGVWWARFEPHTGLSPFSSGLSAVSFFPFQRLLFSFPQKLCQPPAQDCLYISDSCKCNWDSRSFVAKQALPSISFIHHLEPSGSPSLVMMGIWGIGMRFRVRPSQTLSQCECESTKNAT